MKQIATNNVPVVSTKSALELVQAAVAAGNEIGVSATVWVVGPMLQKVAFASADDATAHSRNTSLKKAQTAASTKKSTGWMPEGLSVELPMASDGLLTNVPGGIPLVTREGAVCGAIGIAGGTVEQDAQIAASALSAIGLNCE